VSWRLLLGLQLVPAVAMLIGSYWMPFSPRWLCLKGRYDEAKVVLERMHGGTDDDTFYLREFHQIKAQIELDAEESLGIIDIIKRKSYRKRLGLVIFTATFQQYVLLAFPSLSLAFLLTDILDLLALSPFRIIK
jgi:Sugar (and other) transporter